MSDMTAGIENSKDDCLHTLYESDRLTTLGKFNDAYKLLRLLLRSHLALEAHLRFAQIAEIRGRSDRKQSILLKTIKRYPDSTNAIVELGYYEIKHGSYSDAWSLFKKCLELDNAHERALIGAFDCAYNGFGNLDLSIQIARRLVYLYPSDPRYHATLGTVHWESENPADCIDSYRIALELQADNPYFFINSAISTSRVPRSGVSICKLIANMKKTSEHINKSLDSGYPWKSGSNVSLLSNMFHAAYMPGNLRHIFEPFNSMLARLCTPIIAEAVQQSDETRANYVIGLPTHAHIDRKRIRIGVVSRFFCSHSNSQAFWGFIKSINRDEFEVIVIHRYGSKVDETHLKINAIASEVAYLADSLAYSCWLIKSLDIDVLFYTDLGMGPLDFALPQSRPCSIQITGWGLPHTSGITAIDYYMSSSMLETPEHQEEYTEKLVLLDGLPCCFMSELLTYQNLGRSYFLLPSDSLIYGCIQSLHKIHPDLDLIIERIALGQPQSIFVFIDSGSEYMNRSFMNRLERRAPLAFSRTMFLRRCNTREFISLCDCIDILLDTLYYGSGITAYMTMYAGVPTVSLEGRRLRDGMVTSMYKFLGIDDAPIAASLDEYAEIAISLGDSPSKRLDLKRRTAFNASRLYDDTTYVRSFEKFVKSVVGKNRS